jgi:hypothetical protein
MGFFAATTRIAAAVAALFRGRGLDANGTDTFPLRDKPAAKKTSRKRGFRFLCHPDRSGRFFPALGF